MVAVNVIDGVKYGFRLIGYLIAVLIVAGILAGIGGAFTPGPFNRGNPILALIFYFAALSIYIAGFLGLMYKVIADGVEAGTLSAERGGGSGGGLTSFGGSGGAGNRQRAQQARQQAQRTQQGGQRAQQGGQQRAQQGGGGRQPQQGGQGQRQGGQGQGGQGQQPPEDWEPGN